MTVWGNFALAFGNKVTKGLYRSAKRIGRHGGRFIPYAMSVALCCHYADFDMTR
ncbi:MAG: hypothetical protein IJU35_03335 [Paludibacteraceae bacterium]|nr:hypothetical protein [Paludibacteraceae bacterium]